jgi:hypothetical protein
LSSDSVTRIGTAQAGTRHAAVCDVGGAPNASLRCGPESCERHSPMSLAPCSRCRRHVRAGQICPFCRSSHVLAVGLAALALTACGATAAMYGGPPPEYESPRDPAPVVQPSASASSSAVPTPPEPVAPVTMYGAPPSMRR